MQNDDLRRAQIAVEESRDHYLDLYEFAPVGYLTLTPEGQLAQLNLTAEDSAAAGKIAGDLYANNYGESFEQVSEATGAVLSSLGNFSDDGAGAIEALTTKALTLSQVFGLDVNEAAQAANAAQDFSPPANATSPHTRPSMPATRAMPVARCRIEVSICTCHL